MEKYYVPPSVDESEFDLKNDANGINKARLIKAHEARDKKIREMKDERANMYGFILKKISKESLNEIT